MIACLPLRRPGAHIIPAAVAVGALVLALAAMASSAAASGLPQVAPPGPGAAKGPTGTGSAVEKSYQRRLDAAPRPAAPTTAAPGATVLFPTPGGAVTDTGTSLTGQGGVLRDDQGGVWNCNTSGCFSPGGEFRPMYKTSPATPAGR